MTDGTPNVTIKTARERLLRALADNDLCFCGGDACPTPEQYADAYAHELAEQQRNHFGIGDTPVKAHCDRGCGFCRGVSSAADHIDPEVKR
jgi:hypothetical protein